MRILPGLAATALASLPFAAHGQDASAPADVVVTGRGLGASPADRVVDVVTIDRDRITANASSRLESVLADVAGLQQFRRSDSRSANPTSQGLSLRGVGGNASSRALLILDGVPQADPFGGWVAFPAYATDRLGQIRVTRGGGSGYAGRVAILEFLRVDEGISRLILGRAATPDIVQAATAGGMLSLVGDGIAKAAAGLTSLEEILRVASGD